MTDSLTPSRIDEQMNTAAALVEAIARQWDGCMVTMTDPAGTLAYQIDIGATIRADGVPRLAAAGERAPLQGAEAGRAVAQRMLANPGMILQNLKDGAAGERVVRHIDLLPPAEFFWNGVRYRRKNNGQSVKVSDGSVHMFDMHMEVTPAAGERVDAPAEPLTDEAAVMWRADLEFRITALVLAAWNEGEAYGKGVEGTENLQPLHDNLAAARDSLRSYVLAASPADAPQPAKAAPTLLEACRKAAEWLEGWASADPYVGILRAAIAKAEKAACPAPVEPTTHKLVPTKPTPKMLDAGAMRIAMNEQYVGTAESKAGMVWRDMLAAVLPDGEPTKGGA